MEQKQEVSPEDNPLLFSIIIPVYNAAGYVSKCLDSLLEQDIDKSRYEIICINDGSTDNSLAVLNRYAQQHHNITVIDKSNSGVSATRNLGLEKASGKYVWFVDADDWVAKNCFGTFAQYITDQNPSVILLEYCEVLEKDFSLYENVVFDKSVAKTTVGVPFYVCAVCMAITKKELIDRYSLRFIENITYGEDTLFMRDLLDAMTLEDENQETKHLKLALRCPFVYFYRQHNHSAVNSSWTTNRHRYMESLLSRARLDRQRSRMTNMPEWYTKQYQDLFAGRIIDYMLFWLPGSGLDINETLQELKEEGFYPLKMPVPLEKIGETKSITQKIVTWYRAVAFKYPLIYRLYCAQMAKKYAKTQNTTADE